MLVSRSQRSAAMLYGDSSGVSKALSHAASGQIIDCPLALPDGPLGLKAWVAQHRAQRPGNQQLQKQVLLSYIAAGSRLFSHQLWVEAT